MVAWPGALGNLWGCIHCSRWINASRRLLSMLNYLSLLSDRSLDATIRAHVALLSQSNPYLNYSLILRFIIMICRSDSDDLSLFIVANKKNIPWINFNRRKRPDFVYMHHWTLLTKSYTSTPFLCQRAWIQSLWIFSNNQENFFSDSYIIKVFDTKIM